MREFHVGFGNSVATSRVVAILVSTGEAMLRLRERAEQEGRLIKATQGRRTRAMILTDSNHLILSGVAPETLWKRAGEKL